MVGAIILVQKQDFLLKFELKKNNSFLLNQFGIGLLGVSGKYFPKHQEETIALLKFILNHFHSYLDSLILP